MVFDDQSKYDHYGHSREERKLSTRKLYELSEHEKSNINEITKMIDEGGHKLSEMEGCLTYVEELDGKLANILSMEEKEGLINSEIQTELSHVRKLKAELIQIVTKLRRRR